MTGGLRVGKSRRTSKHGSNSVVKHWPRSSRPATAPALILPTPSSLLPRSPLPCRPRRPGEERDLRIHAGACSQRYRHLSASLLALHRRIGRIELWIVAALVTVIGGLGGMTWALLRMAIEG